MPRVQRRRFAAQGQHGLRQLQHRVRVGALGLDAARARLGWPRQPRVGGPAVVGRRGPRDRRAAAVASAGIDHALGGNHGVLQARAPRRRTGTASRAASGASRAAARARASAPPRRVRVRGWSWLEKTHVGQRSPMTSSTCAMRARHASASHGTASDSKSKTRCSSSLSPRYGAISSVFGEVDLADHHPVAGVLVEHGADAAQQLVRAVVVVCADDVEVAADDVGLRDVGQRGVLADEVHDVGAEAVDPAVEPEAQHVVHGRDDLGVVPVEVGLLGQEQVQVPLLGRLVPASTRAAAEGRQPVVGRRRPARRSRQTYQSRFGSSRDARLPTNHGCWSEVWFGTQSSRTRHVRARGRRRAARRRSRGRRTAGRRRSSRPRRSRSRPSGER